MSRNKQFTINLGDSQALTPESRNRVSDIDDIVFTDLVINDLLQYDGVNWVNIPASALAGGGSGTYTNAIPMPQNLGGLDAGTTFSSDTLDSVLDRLLYPYVAINATSLSADISNSLREKGDTITATINFTANYSLGSAALTDITFKRGGVVQQSGLTNTFAEVDDVLDDTTFTAEVSDGTTTDIVSRSYSFAYPFYYGVGAAGLSAASVAGLTKLIQNNGDKVLGFTPNNQVYYFAYPQSYGLLTRVLDWNGFDITTDFTIRAENIIGLDMTSQPYYIYEFNNLVTHSSQNLTFDT